MNRYIRYTIKGLFITITVAIALFAAMLLAFLLPPVQRKSCDIVKKELKNALGVEVGLGEVRYFPFKTIGLNGLVIYGTDSLPMISVGTAKANVNLRSLWTEKISISGIHIDSLSVDIHHINDTTLNISALQSNDTTSDTRLLIEQLDLRHGKVAIDNKGEKLTIVDITSQIRDIDIDGDCIRLEMRWFNGAELGDRAHVAGVQGKLKMSQDTINVQRIKATYGNSEIDIRKATYITTGSSIYVDIMADHIKASTSDIGRITKMEIPQNLEMTLSGHIKGTEQWITGEDIYMTNGKGTQLKADFKIDGYSNPLTAYVDVKCSQASTTIQDIEEMTGAVLTDTDVDNDPMGQITYTGHIKGIASSLKLNGTLSSKIGHITTTGNASLKDDKDIDITYDLQMASDRLSLSQLTNGKISSLGIATDINGRIADDTRGYLHGQGTITDLNALGYEYSDINVKTLLTSTERLCAMKVQDPNADIEAVAQMRKMQDSQQLEVTARVNKLNTGTTGITPGIPHGSLNVVIGAKLHMKELDDTMGEIWMDGLDFHDDTRSAKSEKMSIVLSEDTAGTKEIHITSDNINGKAKGHYKYSDIWHEVYAQMYKHANNILDKRPVKTVSDVDLDFSIEYANTEQYLQFITDKLRLEDSGTIYGSIKSADHSSHLDIILGNAEYGDIKLKDIKGNIVSDNNSVTLKLNAQDMDVPVFGRIGNIEINNALSHNVASTLFVWDDNNRSHSGGTIDLFTSFSRIGKSLQSDINIKHNYITIHDSTWTMHNSYATIKDKEIDIRNFIFDKGERHIAINGRASDNPLDTMHLSISKMTIEDIMKPDPKDRYTLKGDLTADIDIADMYHNMIFDCNAQVERLIVNGDNLERLNASTKWSKERKALDVDVAIVTGGKSRAHGMGEINNEDNNMCIDFDIDSLSVGFLNHYLKTPISRLEGTTSGKLKLHGPLNDIGLDARLCVNHTDFTVRQTNVGYQFDHNDSVIITPKTLEFHDLQFTDRYGRKGNFGGYITHNMFSGLKLFVDFNFGDQLVLETTEKDNPTYYGTVFGSGELHITGTTSNVNLQIKARTSDGSQFSILPMEKNSISENTRIKFANKDNSKEYIDIKSINESITAQIEIGISQNANIKVIIDPRSDNELTAKGEGLLNLTINKQGDLGLQGKYTIESGLYNFVFDIINKQFIIKNGSTIVWDGDPMDPLLDVTATNTVRASLYDLVNNSVENPDIKKRVDVNCDMLLTNRLSEPNIKFKIRIPSMMNSNQYTIDQYVSTDEEMNRQVFSLLLTGRFYTPQEAMNSTSTTSSQNYLGTAASEILSSQLSRMVSQNKYNIDLGVNYRPGDETMNEEYEMTISTQVGKKILLSGNIGYGRNTTESSDGSVIGDFDVEVKLNKKGNLRAKAYTHSNNDVIYETSPTTQGVGISFREEFDSFKELWRKYIDLLSFKKRRERNKEKEKTSQ